MRHLDKKLKRIVSEIHNSEEAAKSQIGSIADHIDVEVVVDYLLWRCFSSRGSDAFQGEIEEGRCKDYPNCTLYKVNFFCKDSKSLGHIHLRVGNRDKVLAHAFIR